MTGIIRSLTLYFKSLYFPQIHVIDIVEMLILAVLLYFIISWIKNTRAYTLIKGIIILLVFVLLAYLLEMKTILWVMKSVAAVAATALVVIFQPELRKALEQLGQKNVVSSILPFDIDKATEDRYSEKTINELVRSVYDMSAVKTGALIVIEMDIHLTEYADTGIILDSCISSQLIENIFEHNTPLHDGAVIMKGDRLVAATCYLPLSDNSEIGKHLGTRHRAGLGISEVSDCLTIIVSEETGRVSYAYGGKLKTSVTADELRSVLQKLQNNNNTEEKKGKKLKLWKGWEKREETVGK